MKHFVALLFLFVLAAGTAQAQAKPKVKPKRAFAHTTESSQGKTSRAQFRRESSRPVIDLTPHKLETFKTAKANKNYKYKNPRN